MTVIELVVGGDTFSLEFFDALAQASPAELAAIVGLAFHDAVTVRQSAVLVLPHILAADSASPGAIEAMMTLTRDPDTQVRDYACFGLGQQCREIDTPAIREALAARLDDTDDDTRCEALLGLAYRQDARALPRVHAALSRPDGSVWMLELRAAGALGDPQLHPLVAQHLDGWDEPETNTIDAVYRLTDPAGIGDDVLGGVADLYRRRAHGQSEGDALRWWTLMNAMLDIAPHQAKEFLHATAVLLSDDPIAYRKLLEESALATFAASD